MGAKQAAERGMTDTRIAALEAALLEIHAASKDGALDDKAANALAWAVAEDALSGGTAALDAHVAAAVEAERARIRAAVEAVQRLVLGEITASEQRTALARLAQIGRGR